MAAEVSTAISDLVLALSAFHAMFKLFPEFTVGAFGFLVIGSAAFAGVFKFGLMNPSAQVTNTHRFLALMAKTLGVSLVAAAYHYQVNSRAIAHLHVACGISIVFLQTALSSEVSAKVEEAVSTGGVASILLLSLYQMNPYGILGAAIYAAAGLAIGVQGNLSGIPRVDLFHYALVFGNFAFMLGILQSEKLVYYRP